MKDFNIDYNIIEIYNYFKRFKLRDFINNIY